VLSAGAENETNTAKAENLQGDPKICPYHNIKNSYYNMPIRLDYFRKVKGSNKHYDVTS